MCLPESAIEITLCLTFRIFSDEQIQFVFIDPLFLIIIIIPDKTAVLSGFCNGLIPQNLPVLIFCIKIKNNQLLCGQADAGGFPALG